MARGKKDKEELPEGTLSCKGVNGTVTFDGTWVTISRTGFMARSTVGKGEKRLSVSQITSVRWKQPTKLVRGYISFTLPGGNETRSGFGSQTFDAAKDENAVIVAASNAEEFQALRDVIEAAVAERHSATTAPPVQVAAAPDAADQLRKLAELHASGILTDEEFAAKRAALVEQL